MHLTTRPIHRLLLLVNPNASEAQETAREARDFLQAASVDVTEVITDSAEHMRNSIRDHADKVDAAILIGGDGTLHHALPALRKHRMAVGLLPGGTANDFSRCLNTPASITDACRGFLAGRMVGADVAEINGKPFLNVSHIGPGAQVAIRSTSSAKKWLGPLEYVRRGIKLFLEHKPFSVDVTCDTRNEHYKSIQVSVGNAPYFGGGNLIHADSAINDHQLKLYSVRPVRLWHLLLVVPLLRRGRGNRMHGVDRLHGQRFQISTSSPQPISADGEDIGTTPATFEIFPNAIEFLMPNEELHPDDHPHVLLDDRQVAMQDVIASLYEAADYYGEAAPRLENDPRNLEALLDEFGNHRRQGARLLGDIVQDMGAMPRHPDPDRETLEHIADWFRTHLNEDWRGALIDTCVERDREIITLIDKCRACDLPPAANKVLEQQREQIEADIGALHDRLPRAS